MLHFQILSAQKRFQTTKSLRNWATNHGQGEALSFIQQKLWRPQPDLEGATRAALGLPPPAARRPGWTIFRLREATGTKATSGVPAQGTLQLQGSFANPSSLKPPWMTTPSTQTLPVTLPPPMWPRPTHVMLNIPSPRPRHAGGRDPHLSPPRPAATSWAPAPAGSGEGFQPFNPPETRAIPGDVHREETVISNPQEEPPASLGFTLQTFTAPPAHSSSFHLTVTDENPEEPLNLVVSLGSAPRDGSDREDSEEAL